MLAYLVTPEGHTLGMLVIDYVPRQLEPQQVEALQTWVVKSSHNLSYGGIYPSSHGLPLSASGQSR